MYLCQLINLKIKSVDHFVGVSSFSAVVIKVSFFNCLLNFILYLSNYLYNIEPNTCSSSNSWYAWSCSWRNL